MAFENGTDELQCPDCRAKHEAEWHRIPVREPYRLICKKCGSTIASGKGVKDYVSVRLLDQ